MAPWVEALLASPECGQPRPLAGDYADATRFEQDGFLIIPNLLLDDTAGASEVGLEGEVSLSSAMAAFERCGASKAVVGSPDEHEFINEPLLRKVCTHPRLLRLVGAILRQPLCLTEVFSRALPPISSLSEGSSESERSTMATRLRQPQGYSPFHNDMPPGLERYIKVQVFLSDVPTPDHGAFCVAPGTHLHEAAIGGMSAPSGEIPDNAQALTVAAGTAVIFDTRIRHAAMANSSDSSRWSLFLQYTPFWLKQTAAFEARVRGMDERGELPLPLERQILGLELAGSIHWEPQPQPPLGLKGRL
jgi:hypothetical protein